MSAAENDPRSHPEPRRSPLDQQVILRRMFNEVKGMGEPTEEMLQNLWEHLQPAQVTDSLKRVIVDRYKWYATTAIDPLRRTLVFGEELFFLGEKFPGGVFTEDFHKRILLEKIGFAQTAADDREFVQLSSLGVERVFGNSTESQRSHLRAKWYREFPIVYNDLPLLPYAGLRN